MGVPTQNDGAIERADLDGRNRKTIVPEGSTFTPKLVRRDKRRCATPADLLDAERS
jgi:hypothetical protein